MPKYILSLDQGTTSSRAVLFDSEQNIVASSQKEFKQIYPRDGWVEQDPMEIYSSQVAVLSEAVAHSGVSARDIVAIGITNQRETTIVWEKSTGKPVYNAIVWQCRRTAGIIEKLVSGGLTEKIRRTTGLIPDAYFSGSKIAWILDNVEGARKRAESGELLFGTVDTWLLWKMTKGKAHVTDYTNASRTMLFDIHSLDWDDELLHALNIPRVMLPEVCSSSEIYGHTIVQGIDIPIAGIAGDQQAALFGQCCFDKGDVKNTYGTGCFLLMNTGAESFNSKSGLITTIAASAKGRPSYALEGSVFSAGSVVSWLRDEMRLISKSSEVEKFASKVPDSDGVYFVPAFSGLGSPHWDMYARGCIVGITRSTKREHIIRAALESIAFQSYDLISAIQSDTGIEITELRADGGASVNNLLMQFQADISVKTVCRPMVSESTALGAAFLAGLSVGVWRDTDELKQLWLREAVFSPQMGESERAALLRGWGRAVGRSLDWAER
ncbi:MAG: glycerol kinase GlpK [Oscillospiraceae bacterium]|nr:glycerol kinase GlpK [Oscillospiraceae bacterium]MCL2277984.1 glycerol kinase GlpK [Oscillospiraceae bacterium]